ncbi:MAG: dipeptidase [Saprospiraceae bacterium]
MRPLRTDFRILSAVLLLTVFALGACSALKTGASSKNLQRANTLLKTTPIIDTHVDFPWSLVERNEWYKPGYTALVMSHPEGDFDYPRAVKGGLYVPFMSIYIPAKYQNEKGRSKEVADSLITLVEQIQAAYPDQLALVTKADEILSNFQKGIVSLPMGMENGSPLERFEDVAYFHKRGIRYVTLTHSRDNHISDSSYDTLHTHSGLSTFGKQIVKEMNQVGIMVDVSHLTDDAIWDVLEVTTKPVIATHSACRHFTPGYERNLPDTLIRAIAANGGVVAVPFSHYFLSSESREVYFAAEKKMKDMGLSEHTPSGRAFLREEIRKSGIAVKDVADHIDHIRNLVGIDHIGLGGDFDGVGLALPPDLMDVSMYPNLLAELFKRGYTDEEVRKICFENTLRVWRANE